MSQVCVAHPSTALRAGSGQTKAGWATLIRIVCCWESRRPGHLPSVDCALCAASIRRLKSKP